MEVARDGSFTFTIGPKELSKGLRPSSSSPRNEKYLVESTGAISRDGVLQTIDDLNALRLATQATITDGFPYPQIFVFTNHIIICGETKIYEWVAAALVLQLTVAAGLPWCAVDFYNYIYMSNGMVAVERSALDGTYALSDLPIASGIANFNGQVIIGAPDVERV